MSTLSTVLAAILGVAFIAGGDPAPPATRGWPRTSRAGATPRSSARRPAVELLTAATLHFGIALPALAPSGSMLVLMIMIGALFTHQRAHDPIAHADRRGQCFRFFDLVLAYSRPPRSAQV